MSRHLFIKTFGCQMNERDSEIMEQLLAQSGYIPVAEQAKADLIILNTCSIRAKAEQKFFSLLGSLRQQKKRQPGLRIAVAGCVAQQEGERIMALFGNECGIALSTSRSNCLLISTVCEPNPSCDL